MEALRLYWIDRYGTSPVDDNTLWQSGDFVQSVAYRLWDMGVLRRIIERGQYIYFFPSESAAHANS